MKFRYSEYSIEQLHQEIGKLKEQAQKAEQLGNVSEVQVCERKMQVALAYTMSPDDFKKRKFISLKWKQAINLKYLMLTGSLRGVTVLIY